ncbi:hypothetical protein [Dictyobacter aurantiacus]|uniref:Uncharacterized protein n=1 Tax=Dictyobacter aurantiacus TaxID=1936993 RepID=A0A401ZHI6_9CHLR|nr:hypothetical protein [Dictyobacter aurantiacus]GCE06329.1 hypothetical protein KDAU_36580 [Dictyobacter aurantiacus]
MPMTRRRRANPPEQPEQTNSVTEQPTEQVVDNEATKRAPESSKEEEKQPAAAEATPARPENNPPAPAYPPSFVVAQPPATPVLNNEQRAESPEAPSTPPQRPERAPRADRVERHERHEYTPSIEGGRRTSRGELFRRPPQIPTPAPVQQPPASAAPLQPPSHEISLPLGNLLHLAYNPGYTGSDEARSALLQKLANESKAGGRARCWSCGSLAIVYDRWNTRSKTFGEVGIAFCEICGVWSVM